MHARMIMRTVAAQAPFDTVARMRSPRPFWLLAGSVLATFSLFVYVLFGQLTAERIGEQSSAAWALAPLLLTTLATAFSFWSALRKERSGESRARQVADYWLKRSDELVALATIAETFAATDWPRSSEEDEDRFNDERAQAIRAARGLRVELAKLHADAVALDRAGAEDEARVLVELIDAFSDPALTTVVSRRGLESQ